MTKPNLQELLVCRNLLADDTIKAFLDVMNSPDDTALQAACSALLIDRAEALGLSGNLLKAYFIYTLSHDSNLAARITEMSDGNIGPSLHEAFVHDIRLLDAVLRPTPGELLGLPLLDDYTPTTLAANEAFETLCTLLEKTETPEETADSLLTYYRRYGYGDIASYRAFRWNKHHQLTGIQHFEPIRFADLIGYENQKEQLSGNTLAFLRGKPANNTLLVGARGTGKSSSVKALANEYYNLGLRLLQLTKPQLVELPQIMETLRHFASKKFIIFLDDLSFEEFEVEYKYLKSAIEGGVESRPDNVLIYATSNRRHIIKETWRDREDSQEELYRNDSVNETISLSDRFGLIINYLSPTQQEYLAIIDHELRKKGIVLDDEELRIQGLRWEATHSGRSGRVAQQFVAHYLGQKA